MNSIRYFFMRWIPKGLVFSSMLCLFPLSGAAQTPVSRKVLVLYNSETGQSPTINKVFVACQSILNYYGILPDYRDVMIRPLPDLESMAEYRGIITTFDTDHMSGAKGFLTWLSRQFASGKRVVVLGYVGGSDNTGEDSEQQKLLDEIYRELGLVYGSDFTIDQSLLRYAHKDEEGVEFERTYPELPVEYEKYTPLHEKIKTYLAIKRIDREESVSSVVITGPSGGFAREGYFLWEEPVTFRRQWYINPFMFFEEALGLKGLPRLDPTTLNGNRVSFSHIDADGFGGLSRVVKRAFCAEVIKEQVLEAYDFPVTASVIVGEIDPDAVGNHYLVTLAREIFSLPNIEAASHSYSHPFYWDPQYEHKEAYDDLHGILIPRYSYDPSVEIDQSVDYINKNLLPPEKSCQVFLWSGNCDPLASHIARVDALGVLNMNGGDTLFDDYNNSYTSVAPLYRKAGKRIQFYIGQANENIMTNLWSQPEYGFRGIITTMKRTGFPRRIKPIDIYYHFFSGEHHASLRAVQDVYEWVLKQDTAPVFTSDYIRMVQGYLSAQLQEETHGRYIIEDYGRCLTVRFDLEDRVPNLSESENVLGYTHDPQGLYVSLVPGKRAVISLSRAEGVPVKQPYIKRASGWVYDFKTENRAITFSYDGFGEGDLEVAGLEPESDYDISGTAVGDAFLKITTDENGILSINGICKGTINIGSL